MIDSINYVQYNIGLAFCQITDTLGLSAIKTSLYLFYHKLVV